MAKVLGPLFSFDARGKLAKSVVYLAWKGINDVRQYVIPANPRTVLQEQQRGYFKQAVNDWHTLPFTANDREAWDRATLGQPLSGFNLFIRYRIYALRNLLDWSHLHDVIISNVTSSSATITCKCSLNKSAKLRYGTQKTSLLQEVSGTYDPTTQTWTFNLDNLFPDKNYYFLIYNSDPTDGALTGIYMFRTTI